MYIHFYSVKWKYLYHTLCTCIFKSKNGYWNGRVEQQNYPTKWTSCKFELGTTPRWDLKNTKSEVWKLGTSTIFLKKANSSIQIFCRKISQNTQIQKMDKKISLHFDTYVVWIKSWFDLYSYWSFHTTILFQNYKWYIKNYKYPLVSYGA